MRIAGHYKKIGETRHFIPDPLPPKNPPFKFEGQVANLYDAFFGKIK